MNVEVMAKGLHGLQTISSICKKLKISEKTAINYIHELRRNGYVKTTRGSKGVRFYEISLYPKKEIGYPGLYDIINKYSKLKITKPYEYRIHDKEITVEDAIVRALKTYDFRIIMASIGLFGHVNNWSLLYKLAKKERVGRFVGALYDLSRKYIRVKRMDKRIERWFLKSKTNNKYIIPKLKNNDFIDIEKKWHVFIPFNRKDLMRYKE